MRGMEGGKGRSMGGDMWGVWCRCVVLCCVCWGEGLLVCGCGFFVFSDAAATGMYIFSLVCGLCI